MIPPPLGTNFEAALLGKGEDSNAERCVHKQTSRRDHAKATILVVRASPGFDKLGPEIRPKGV